MINVVKEVRKNLGLSVRDFAKAAGFRSIQQVYSLECGKAKAGFNLINKMVKNLNNNGFKAELTIILDINDERLLVQ